MKSSQIIALVIAVGATAWIASGQLELGGPSQPDQPNAAGAESVASRASGAEAAPADGVAERQHVRVTRLEARPMLRQAVVMGRSEADKRVELRAEIIGQVSETLVEKGSRVEAGAPILRIDVEDRRAAVAEAQAALHQRRIEREAARRLTQKGFNSEIRLAEAEATLAAAEAQLSRAEIALAHTTIAAPFAGILEERLVEAGDYVMEGDPVAVMVSLDPIVFAGQVTEQEVVELSRGSQAEARLLGGETITGTLTYIARTADASTRTYRIEVEAPNPDTAIPDGLTARLSLPLEHRMGHKVSPSVLSLNDAGEVGVKVVDEDNRVRFLPVTILGDTADGIWLGDLPTEIALITVGHDFVVPGEHVVPQWSEPLLASRTIE